MGSTNKLSRGEIEHLVVVLQAAQDEADSLGETAERNRLAAAAGALEAWLRDGGRRPPAIDDYAYLLDGVGVGQVAANAPPHDAYAARRALAVYRDDLRRWRKIERAAARRSDLIA